MSWSNHDRFRPCSRVSPSGLKLCFDFEKFESEKRHRRCSVWSTLYEFELVYIIFKLIVNICVSRITVICIVLAVFHEKMFWNDLIYAIVIMWKGWLFYIWMKCILALMICSYLYHKMVNEVFVKWVKYRNRNNTVLFLFLYCVRYQDIIGVVFCVCEVVIFGSIGYCNESILFGYVR